MSTRADSLMIGCSMLDVRCSHWRNRTSNIQHPTSKDERENNFPFSPRAHAGSSRERKEDPAWARGLNTRGSEARSKRSGLGLIELLISLSICAALLTAVGVAVDASFKSYQVNQEQAILTNRVRLTLFRVLAQIRTTEAHQPYTAGKITSFAGGATVTDTGFSMFDDTGAQISYVYDSPSKELRMIKAGTTHVMLAGVNAFQVKMEPMKSALSVKTGSNTYDLLMRATILITVGTNSKTSKSSETTDTQTVTVSSSVMPRRNVW